MFFIIPPFVIPAAAAAVAAMNGKQKDNNRKISPSEAKWSAITFAVMGVVFLVIMFATGLAIEPFKIISEGFSPFFFISVVMCSLLICIPLFFWWMAWGCWKIYQCSKRKIR